MRRVSLPVADTLALRSARKRSGAGAFCGLQNRCPAPVAGSGVGSIPMRFRHFGSEGLRQLLDASFPSASDSLLPPNLRLQ